MLCEAEARTQNDNPPLRLNHKTYKYKQQQSIQSDLTKEVDEDAKIDDWYLANIFYNIF